MNVHYYPQAEERFNIISHLVACIVSFFLVIFLVIKGFRTNEFWTVFSCFIYGISLVMLFAASTLYHSAEKPYNRHILNIVDHTAIYVLIAGTYTPFAIVAMEDYHGWTLFKLVWLVAFIAILFKVKTIGKYPILSAAIYTILGWMVLFFLKDLYQAIDFNGIIWLFIGGFFYSVGAVLFCLDKMEYNHAIFHVLVILGALCHFISIYFYIL